MRINSSVDGELLSLDHIDIGSFFGHLALVYPKPDLYIGGEGMLSRSILELEDVFPRLRDRLDSEPGKIVIAGHGLNVELTEYLAARNRPGAPIPVLADAVDYIGLIGDLEALRDSNPEIDFRPHEEALLRARRIVEIADGGAVQLEQYRFGARKPPESILGASFVINCCGPVSVADGLLDQLEILAPDGELLIATIVRETDVVAAAGCDMEYRAAPAGDYTRIIRTN